MLFGVAMNLELAQLTQLICQLNRPDIRSVDALFAKMLQDQVAARMLSRLLYWFPKAVKIGGWVYKSWRDWDAECGLSPAQVKRVHHDNILEKFGIQRKLMKANGAPTTHYLLDTTTFLKQMAEFLQQPLHSIQTWLHVPITPATKTPKVKSASQPMLTLIREAISVQSATDVADIDVLEVVDNSPQIGTRTAKAWWQATQEQLRLQFSAILYEELFKRLAYVDFSLENATLTISAPSEHIQRKVQAIFDHSYHKIFSRIVGMTCKIVVVVSPRW
jgi:hypothetical protein